MFLTQLVENGSREEHSVFEGSSNQHIYMYRLADLVYSAQYE